MNKKLLLSLFALVGVSVCLSAADEARLLRFPATNGNEIVFSYAGDLYRVPVTGGEAQRLTSHVGYEMFPRFSPDGKTIAFTGQYDGNTEVYTIPAAGGEPQRLTYTATNSRDDLGDRMGPNNIVMTWTPMVNRSFIVTVSVTVLPVSFILSIKRVVCPKLSLCPRVDSVVILPTASDWLTTVPCVNSVLGSIIKAVWRMMSGYTIRQRNQWKI